MYQSFARSESFDQALATWRTVPDDTYRLPEVDTFESCQCEEDWGFSAKPKGKSGSCGCGGAGGCDGGSCGCSSKGGCGAQKTTEDKRRSRQARQREMRSPIAGEGLLIQTLGSVARDEAMNDLAGFGGIILSRFGSVQQAAVGFVPPDAPIDDQPGTDGPPGTSDAPTAEEEELEALCNELEQQYAEERGGVWMCYPQPSGDGCQCDMLEEIEVPAGEEPPGGGTVDPPPPPPPPNPPNPPEPRPGPDVVNKPKCNECDVKACLKECEAMCASAGGVDESKFTTQMKFKEVVVRTDPIDPGIFVEWEFRGDEGMIIGGQSLGQLEGTGTMVSVEECQMRCACNEAQFDPDELTETVFDAWLFCPCIYTA
jgi:hypothetical protein